MNVLHTNGTGLRTTNDTTIFFGELSTRRLGRVPLTNSINLHIRRDNVYGATPSSDLHGHRLLTQCNVRRRLGTNVNVDRHFPARYISSFFVSNVQASTEVLIPRNTTTT